MEKRTFTPIGSNLIHCNVNCENKGTDSFNGKPVCAVLLAPARGRDDYHVVVGTPANEMRYCIRTNLEEIFRKWVLGI